MLYSQDHHINVHKVVMAACSKFFKDQLCKVNVQVNKSDDLCLVSLTIILSRCR